MMRQGILMAGLILIGAMALFNCSMLQGGDGIGLWISGIFSTFAIPVPILLFLTSPKLKWVQITLFIASITMALPLIISEYPFPIHRTLEYALLPLNIGLIALCVLSLALMMIANYRSKEPEECSDNS